MHHHYIKYVKENECMQKTFDKYIKCFTFSTFSIYPIIPIVTMFVYSLKLENSENLRIAMKRGKV